MEIEFERGNLFYHKTGCADEKKKVIILFHGVGQDHTIFNPLLHDLKDQYICYTFDLFFHGRSKYSDPDTPVSKAEWKRALARFVAIENIDRFDVLGYSLGGRAALATTEAFPDKVDNLYMVAGEGLRKNFWYSWATHPFFGKPIFKSVTRNPSSLFTLIKIGEQFKLISAAARVIALSQMKSAEKRKQVYGSWIVFSKLNVAASELKVIADKNKINLFFLFGSIDQIMTPREAETIRKQIPEATVEILNTSHAGLIRKLSHYIKSRIKPI